MAASQFSLIIALLPSRNMQKWGKMSRFLHYFPTQHGIIWSKTWQCTPWSNTFSALCRRIVQPLASYCLSPVVVLSNLSRRILYLFVLRQKHPSSNKTLPDSSRFSDLFAIFATSFRCPNRFEYYQFGVGYCLIRTRGNARSPRTLVSSLVVYLNNYNLIFETAGFCHSVIMM